MDYTKQLDYSSLSTFLDCPRKFMFQYVFHFRPDRPSIHLVFGSSWHYGLETTYRMLQKGEVLSVLDATEISRKAFNLYWKIAGEPFFFAEDVFPKNPGHAANMYHKYWTEFLKETEEKKIVAVEAPFVISLSPGLPDYIGRQDLLFEDRNGYLEIVDHKTAKSVNAITSLGYESSYQTSGYLTSGYLYYDKIPTMTYSVALCQKTKIAFVRYSFMRTRTALEQFLNEIEVWAGKIIVDIERCNEEASRLLDRNDLPSCFPRTPGYACTTYFSKCPYYDLCMLRNNPLQWKDNPPQGYSINEWNPEEHEAEMAKLLAEAAQKLTVQL